MAVRELKDRIVIHLNPNKEFDAGIPAEFLEHEPDREHVLYLWENFRTSVKKLCRMRRSVMMNRHSKKEVFHSGMENLCKAFNRQTENIKVRFFEEQKNKTRKTHYGLALSKLSSIPEGSRNARSCVAEIPSREPEAVVAQFVAYEVSGQQQQQQQQQQPLPFFHENDDDVAVAPIVLAVEEVIDNDLIATSDDIVRMDANHPQQREPGVGTPSCMAHRVMMAVVPATVIIEAQEH